MALYEDSLGALAHLLQRVSAPRWEAHIRSDIEAWRVRRDATQHSRKYGGHSTYSDWVIHSQNGHRVSEIQEIWANKLLSCLQGILQNLAERPDDPRQERKILNGLNRHRSSLRKRPSGRTPSKSKIIGSDSYLRVICCQQCGRQYATHLSIDSVIAGDLIRDYLYDAYETGATIELVDSLLDGTIENLTKNRARVRRAAESAGITVEERRLPRDRCATCGDEVTIRHWTLMGDGPIRFELADFERRSQDVDLTASPRDSGASEQTDFVREDARCKPNTIVIRLWGAAIVVLAFCVLIAQFRFLNSQGVPAATGSLRGNWGLLLLLGLPSVVLIGGTLQAFSGVHIREYLSVFGGQTIMKKIIVSAAAVAIAVAAVILASIIG